jgi:hypothetical protein
MKVYIVFIEEGIMKQTFGNGMVETDDMICMANDWGKYGFTLRLGLG